MLGLFSRRRPSVSPPSRRIRPVLERLEVRDCPSTTSSDTLWYILNTQPAATSSTAVAPTITLSVTYNQKRSVTLTGQVTDAQPGGLRVTFSGQMTGTTVTDANGNYSYTADAAGLGTVSAQVTDAAGLTSNIAQVSLTSNSPVITNFHATAGLLGSYTFSGIVTDESPNGLVVTFGGNPVSVTGKTAMVNADGSFSLTVTLNGLSTDNGTVTAQTADWWGLQSNIATCTVMQTT